MLASCLLGMLKKCLCWQKRQGRKVLRFFVCIGIFGVLEKVLVLVKKVLYFFACVSMFGMLCMLNGVGLTYQTLMHEGRSGEYE